jgi:hypothetical protein
MGYRELFLVLTSIVLLTLLMTQINTNTVQGRDALQELEMEHTAAAIAQQFIEEAKSKNFDGQVGLVNPMESDFFTPAGSLGPGAGETYPNFNDVDDYDELTRTVYVDGGTYDPNSTSGIPFNVSIAVQYVSEANPDSAVTYETYLKRMTVTVTSTYMPGSITAKHVFSYYGVNLL